jgi:magnesium and cobalt transporter
MFLKIKKMLRRGEPETVRDTIEDLIEEKDISIKSDERQLLGNVLDLRDLKAEDVMVPRAEIIAAPDTVLPDDLLGLMVHHGYSAMPIYHDTLDTIIGYVHIKDILSFIYNKKELNVHHLIRKSVLFISPAMQILDLLLEMKQNAHNIAIVADEHGGTDGMVCFSDLMEEIVGDIQDADYQQTPQVNIKEDGTVLVDARILLEELEEKLSCKIAVAQENGEDIETLGGLINNIANRVPTRGEIILHPDGFEFEILDADPRRIKKVIILKRPNAENME